MVTFEITGTFFLSTRFDFDEADLFHMLQVQQR